MRHFRVLTLLALLLPTLASAADCDPASERCPGEDTADTPIAGPAADTDVLPAPALRGCAELVEAEDRLVCYDTVMGRPPDAEPPTAVEGAAPAEVTEAAPEPAEPAPPPSALARRWQLVAQTDRGPFVITPYKPTFVLPVSWYETEGESPLEDERIRDEIEIAYQISFKTKILPDLLGSRGDLWFAYTQKSFWQAYGDSSPFRETNYEPEAIYSYRTQFNFLGLHGRLLTVGLNHQSNGRSEPFSRSWNRVTAGALFDHGRYAMQVRGWWRLPDTAGEDDNPGIIDYVGRGEINQFYQFGEQTVALLLRSNFDPEAPRGSVQLDYSFPLGGPVKGYLQAFHGYGDSLISYDRKTTRVGIGLMLTDWL